MIKSSALCFITEFNLHEPFQSAYRPKHSTETALLRIQNDVLLDLDANKGVVLVLLDLSAAFDTIDHAILDVRLRERIGLRDQALDWVNSYHRKRTQKVVVANAASDEVTLYFGGPQGSLMGPEDYKIYTLPVGDIIRKHGFRFTIYADDTQLYVAFDIRDAGDMVHVIGLIENCVSEIKRWMTSNLLKLNSDKTEVLIIAPSNAKPIDINRVLNIGGATVKPTNKVRNIGVIFDSTLSMHDHVSTVCKTCYYHLRRIASIRRYITKDACQSLVQSMVMSRLDYANALLYGLPKNEINRLQRIQNMAARVTAKLTKHDRITPVLMSLHWLPVEQRIVFKTLSMTYQAIHKSAPVYIQELVEVYTPRRSLRSETAPITLVPRKARTVKYGERAFRNAAPKLWNALPPSVRSADSHTSFKKLLKTHLFRYSYL